MDNSNETPIRNGKESDGIDLLGALRIARSAGGALGVQAGLYGQLARVEWLEEKVRLRNMLLMGLLAFAGTLCLLLFTGIAALALSWETPYRLPTAIALLVIYGAGIGVAWHRLGVLSAAGSQSFAALREELAIDATLLRSRL
ncbi:MAG TPA: hypothetical protein VN248_07160 [Arenimonas sp.]|nr:hypothetical protein [Arenimonas sp.]